MLTHVYSTEKGEFNIPKEWKLLVGEDVILKKYPLGIRLSELGIPKKWFFKLVRQLDDFNEWFNEREQRILSVRLAMCNKDKIVAKRKATCLKKFGVSNPLKAEEVKKKIAETNVSKFGSANPLANKEIREKANKTIQETYGVSSTLLLDSVKEKIKQTCKERYGVENPILNPEIKEKAKKTTIDKYGTLAVLRIQEIKQKSAETSLRKYGVSNPAMISEEEIITRLKEFGIKPLERIVNMAPGIEYTGVCLSCGKEFTFHFSSGKPTVCRFCNRNLIKLERQLTNFLTLQGIRVQQHLKPEWLDYKELDLYLPDYKIAIEINGALTHNSDWHPFDSRSPKSPSYHKFKSEKCLEKGISLIHLWEHWDHAKAINFLKSRLGLFDEVIFARNTEFIVESFSSVNDFIEESHIHGNIPASYYYSLRYKGQIVYAASFRRTSASSVELTRLCVKQGIKVIGGAEKIMAHVLPKLKADGFTELTSFAYRDLTPNPENSVYSHLGFNFRGFTSPSLFYYVHRTLRTPNGIIIRPGIYSRLKFQIFRVKQELGFSEDFKTQDLKSLHVFRVYDSGNLRFSRKI